MHTQPKQQQKDQIYALKARLLSNADNAYHVNARPASDKQCWFLAKLIVEAGEGDSTYWNNNEVLTSAKASNQIDSYLKYQQ